MALLRIGVQPMSRTDTAAETAKADPACATLPKASKPQRRMARPAPNDAEAGSPPPVTAPVTQARTTPATGSKSAAVVALLERENGATLAELITSTGWLPHTTRAALTGLRKKGHVIERSKRGDETCYRIAPRASDIVKPA